MMEQRILTSNGVNLYYYRQPNTHSICISLYVRAGALYENRNNGITHFLEHMHFRNLGGKKQKQFYC
jgi:predicted Zn-dependent peptidase